MIADQDSKNRVCVNGQHTGENTLHSGYTVVFGQVRFVFQMNQEGGAI